MIPSKTKGSSRGKNSVNIVDIVIMIIITLLCLTCILPFVHIAAKSISSNTMVLSKSVYLIPKEITFNAYISIFKESDNKKFLLRIFLANYCYLTTDFIFCFDQFQHLVQGRFRSKMCSVYNY